MPLAKKYPKTFEFALSTYLHGTITCSNQGALVAIEKFEASLKAFVEYFSQFKE